VVTKVRDTAPSTSLSAFGYCARKHALHPWGWLRDESVYRVCDMRREEGDSVALEGVAQDVKQQLFAFDDLRANALAREPPGIGMKT